MCKGKELESEKKGNVGEKGRGCPGWKMMCMEAASFFLSSNIWQAVSKISVPKEESKAFSAVKMMFNIRSVNLGVKRVV